MADTRNGTDGVASGANGVKFSHPLFLHPSDMQGAPIVTQALTGGANYPVWSRAMRLALRGKHKLGFIDGSCLHEAQDDGMRDQWDRCNAVVLSWILNTVSQELQNSLIFFHDARSVWLDLQERFDKVTGSRIFSLHREISDLRQGSSTVSAYYTKLRELWDEQSAILPLPSCQCDNTKIYAERAQQQRLLQFLVGLNETYAAARSQILLMSPLPSINQAFAMIAEDEAQRDLVRSTRPGSVDTMAMAVRGRGRGQGRGRGGPPPQCSHCHRKGYIKDRCWLLVGFPADFKGNKEKYIADTITLSQCVIKDPYAATANLVTPTLTHDQYVRLLEFLKQDDSAKAGAVALTGAGLHISSVTDAHTS